MANQKPHKSSRDRLSSLYNSVSLRLFLVLFGIVFVVFAVHAYVTLNSASDQWLGFVERAASRTSELIKGGTYYAMLLNRKEELHGTIVKIAQTPGVAAVRIYDKRGTIIFSADPQEVGRRVDLKAEACIICHDSSQPLRSVPTGNRTRVYEGADGTRILGVITAIENRPECAAADCHAHAPDQTILGVLDVMMSMKDVDDQIRATAREMALSTLVMVAIIGAATALFINRVIRLPVQRLIAGTRRLALGDLDTQIDVGARNQIGQLAESFNRMTDDLRRAREQLTEWSATLERKVVDKTEELGRAQRQIVQMEKMASLGKLAATVAHELNNPLAGILTYAKVVEKDLGNEGFRPEDRAEVARYLDLIQRESRRCGDIVRNLLLFARPSGGAFAYQAVNPILDRAVMIIHHHVEMAQIELETSPIAGDDVVLCDADQLQQALVALLVNSVEAMSAGGTLAVRAEGEASSIRISVSDTGVGIPPEVLPHIFEPFFSTKENGTGVGLGLAVVYGIVQRHGGRIDVHSDVGRGTTFTLVLPRRREAAAPAPPGGVGTPS